MKHENGLLDQTKDHKSQFDTYQINQFESYLNVAIVHFSRRFTAKIAQRDSGKFLIHRGIRLIDVL